MLSASEWSAERNRGRERRGGRRLLAFSAVLLYFLGMGEAVWQARHRPRSVHSVVSVPQGLPTTTAANEVAASTPSAESFKSPPVPAVPVAVTGVAAYDPQGDGHENDQIAGRATDGNLSSFWSTEVYQVFAKPGVGLVLDAGRTVVLKTLRVRTDTPGFTATILAGPNRDGPLRPVSTSRIVAAATTFALHSAAPERFYVLWITRLPQATHGAAHVNEVQATAAN